MPSKSELTGFLRNVVVQVYPDDVEEFDLGGAAVVSDFVEHRPDAGRPRARLGGAEFEFIRMLEPALPFIHVIAATITICEMIPKAKHLAGKLLGSEPKSEPGNAEIARRWKEELLKAGVAEKNADAIVQRFTDGLVSLLRPE